MPQQEQQAQPPQQPGRPSTTRRRLLAGAGASAVVAAVGGLGAGAGSAAAEGPRPVPAAAAPGADPRIRRAARSVLRRMSLAEKVGQLFVVEVYGRTADASHPKNTELYGVATPAEVIAKYQPGGVIYFDARRGPDNMHDPLQVARLSNGLQRAALHAGARLPLHVSVDQEGGSVVYRMLAPATQLPGNMALAAGRSRTDTRRSAEIIGTELAAMGVNQDYAPVSDVNVNPDNPVIGVRSFGSDPRLCAELVDEAVRGYHSAGIASAAKHFPGHGDTATDSHTGLPVITHSRAQLDEIDLPPFRAAIARGVDTIMTAHIVVPSLDDSGVPATMSPRIVTGLLREELGFGGLIVTDALDMGGATEDFPPDVAPVRALQAGCDQLVLAPKSDVAHQAVLDAVRSGTVSAARLDEAVLRVLEHKLRRGLLPGAPGRPAGRPYVKEAAAERIVGSRRHAADNARITARTVTLLRNQKRTLPLSGAKRSLLVTGWGTAQVGAVAEAIGRRRGQSATARPAPAVPTAADVEAAATAARGHQAVVVLTNAGVASDKGAAQGRLVAALVATGVPVVAVAVQNPYDVRHYPNVPAALATYSYTTPSLDALVDVVYGEQRPQGRLPVSITSLSDPATTLYPFGHGLSY